MKVLIKSKAPCRISFAGGGTDIPPYTNVKGGAVLSTTINLYAYATLKPTSGETINISSHGVTQTIPLNHLMNVAYDGNLDIPKAAIKIFKAQTGFDLNCHCEAPSGSGLGTSSAETVAVIGALKEFLNRSMTDYEIADLAYRIERVELGVKGGYQDQYASAFGGFNFIEFKGPDVVVNALRIRPEVLNELKACLLLCSLQRTRLSGEIHKRISERFMKGDKTLLESLDYLKKIAIDMKNTLMKGDLSSFGEFLHLGWEHKKRMDQKISDPYIDKLYHTARSLGALGGKILGAGGGGHILFYCDFEVKHLVADELRKMGCEIVNFDFDFNGLQTWRMYEARVRA